MKKYIMESTVVVSLYCVVHANSDIEAFDLANDMPLMTIIHDNSEDAESCWMLDEIDGMPFDVKISK